MNKYFLYVGNAYPHKNLDRLISAIVKLNQNLDEKVLLKISSSRNEFTRRLEQKIKELNAERYVELLGFVEDKKLKILYKNSVAFVFPSLSEGFGLPGIEAMENETLVLCSDIPVFKEIYENNAVYFKPESVDSMCQSMSKIINLDTKNKKNLIIKAKTFAKKYSWSKMAKETLNIYESSSS